MNVLRNIRWIRWLGELAIVLTWGIITALCFIGTMTIMGGAQWVTEALSMVGW